MFYFLQRLKEPVGTAIHNNSCGQAHLRTNSSHDCSDRHRRNAVLENMYQSLGDDEGGVHVCIREAFVHFRDIDHTTRVKVCAATNSRSVLQMLVHLQAYSHSFVFIGLTQFDF